MTPFPYYRNRIKYDTDPENDYQDGANARDRYWRKRLTHFRVWWLAIGMLVEYVLWRLNV